MPNNTPYYLSRPENCMMLGISRATLWRVARHGHFHASIGRGALWRTTRDDAIAALCRYRNAQMEG